nr:MAG TPA: hypothetical protein [Caudoviricetes sp.]
MCSRRSDYGGNFCLCQKKMIDTIVISWERGIFAVQHFIHRHCKRAGQ